VITQNDVTIALAFGRITVKHFRPPPQQPLLFCVQSVYEELTVVEVFVPTEASQVAEPRKVLVHFYNTDYMERPSHVGARFLTVEECNRSKISIETHQLEPVDDECGSVSAANFVEMQCLFNIRPPARLDQGVHIVGLGHVWFDNKRFNFGDGSDTDDTGTE
jgi:hypothetical protein